MQPQMNGIYAAHAYTEPVTDTNDDDRARDLIRTLTDEHLDAGDKLMNRAAMEGLERAMINNFRTLREDRGWSQSQLSERLADFGFELHQTTIAKMEAGKRPLRVAEMFALSHVFRMSPGAVFFMSDSSPVPEMAEMNEEIARSEEIIRQNKDEILGVVGFLVDMTADVQTKRNEIVRALREASKTDG